MGSNWKWGIQIDHFIGKIVINHDKPLDFGADKDILYYIMMESGSSGFCMSSFVWIRVAIYHD